MNTYKFDEYSDKPDVKVKKIWTQVNALGYSLVLIVIMIVSFLCLLFHWDKLIIAILICAFFLALIFFIIESIFIKKVKYDLISFEITTEYIVIQEASFLYSKVKVIPVEKIYFIDMKTGPILKRYKLCNLKIGTMAYQHVIEGIDINKADYYKEKIYSYSSIDKEDKNEIEK